MSAYTGDLHGAQFEGADLTGASLRGVLLNEARLEKVELANARFRMVDLSGVVMRAVSLAGAAIDGEVGECEGLTINGVEVMPLVEAELLRRDPVRSLLRPTDPDGLRAVWAALERNWAATYDRVAAMPAGTVDVSVEDEWSFTETLRHLIFATDGWLGAVRGSDRAFHPWGLPFAEVDEFVGPDVDLGIDHTAAPSYAEVLAVRADRSAMVRDLLATVTVQRLAEEVDGPPWQNGRLSVLRCLRVIVNEEYEHRRFAERDLDLIAARAAAGR